jgi:hypothetical protein
LSRGWEISTRQGQYEEQISRDQYVSRNILSQNSRARRDNDSDEEFILQELGSVRKTTTSLMRRRQEYRSLESSMDVQRAPDTTNMVDSQVSMMHPGFPLVET